jgi:serine/threonine protein kinase
VARPCTYNIAGSPPPPSHTSPLTWQINAASGDRLQQAKREIATMRALSHPNCLPLLDHAVCAGRAGAAASGGAGGGGRTPHEGCTVLLLFPAFEDGTLFDELQRLAAARQRLATQDVLDVFEQVGLSSAG